MMEFKNLSKYVTKHKAKMVYKNDGLKDNGNGTKMDKLLDGILNGLYENNEQAAFDIYNSGAENKRFQMLKSRIKDRFISNIFQIDTKKIKNLKKYHLNSVLTTKYLTAGQLMINFAFGVEGEKMLKQGLRMSKKHQFSGLIVFAARLLRSRASFVGTKKEVNYYTKLITENIEIYEAELESDKMRDEMFVDFRQTYSLKNKAKLQKFWKRVNYLDQKYNNHVIKMNKVRIGAKYFEIIGDFRALINICDEGEDYILKNSHFYELPRHRDFATLKLEASVILKDYEAGRKNAEVAMGLFANNINALIVFEYYIILCFHSKNYLKAWEIFESALANPLFETYPLERKEKWKLFEAYLNFISPRSKRKFKLFKFLNEVTVYSKDKRGLNVSIMIAQIILLLDEGNFDMLINKADSFKIYFRRYVTRHINYRTFYMVKMLEVMFRYNFDYKKVKDISDKFYIRLSDKKGHYKGNIESLEIIPYEELWKQILERLKKFGDYFSVEK
jgi:hypothetical protein